MSLWCDYLRDIHGNSSNCKHYIINNDKSSLTWPDISVGWSVKDTKKMSSKCYMQQFNTKT